MSLVPLLVSVLLAPTAAEDAVMLLQRQAQLHRRAAGIHDCGPVRAKNLTHPHPLPPNISLFPPSVGHPLEGWTNNTCDVTVGDLCYKLFQGSAEMFDGFCTMNNVCQSHGGTLATLATHAERKAVTDFLAAEKLPPGFASNVWNGAAGGNCVQVGGYQNAQSKWLWADGTPDPDIYVHHDLSYLHPGMSLAQNCTCIIDKPCSWVSNVSKSPPGVPPVYGFLGDCQLQDFTCEPGNDPASPPMWDGDFFLCSSEIEHAEVHDTPSQKDVANGLSGALAVSLAALFFGFF